MRTQCLSIVPRYWSLGRAGTQWLPMSITMSVDQGGIIHQLTHIRRRDATAFTLCESICRTESHAMNALGVAGRISGQRQRARGSESGAS
jgi:hypothetical protein